jgi:hypothetical protein
MKRFGESCETDANAVNEEAANRLAKESFERRVKEICLSSVFMKRSRREMGTSQVGKVNLAVEDVNVHQEEDEEDEEDEDEEEEEEEDEEIFESEKVLALAKKEIATAKKEMARAFKTAAEIFSKEDLTTNEWMRASSTTKDEEENDHERRKMEIIARKVVEEETRKIRQRERLAVVDCLLGVLDEVDLSAKAYKV